MMRPITDTGGLAIRGDTAVNLTISGDVGNNDSSEVFDDNVRVFFVMNSAVLYISDLTIANGIAQGGHGGNSLRGGGGGIGAAGGGIAASASTLQIASAFGIGGFLGGGGGSVINQLIEKGKVDPYEVAQAAVVGGRHAMLP